MELRHLRYFIAAAEEEHFGRAAERLHIAQPALSRQIRDLESDLNTELFDRLPRGVKLSAMGAAFLPHARRLVVDFEYVRQHTRRMAAGEVGRLRVGFIEPACQHRGLPDAFRRFRAAHPGVELELRPMHSVEQFKALREHQIDAGVVYSLSEEVMEFNRRTIMSDRFKLALPEAHPLAARRELWLADLQAEDFIWLRRDVAPGYANHLQQACMAGGLAPRVMQEAGNEATILSLVSVGMGIGLVISGEWRLPQGVVLRPVQDLSTLVQIDLIWRRTDRSPVLDRLIETIGSTVE